MQDEEYGEVTASDVTEDSELYSEEPIVEETVELEEEEEVVSKSEYEKLKEIAENQRIRAEKAEKKLKVSEPEKPKETQDLSTKDVLVLVQANVPSDDIDEVVEYARFKNIPVSEALKSPTVKAILADRKENRTVAEASNTGTVRRGSSKISDDALLSKASKGELPDSDEDLRRLIRLQKGIK